MRADEWQQRNLRNWEQQNGEHGQVSHTKTDWTTSNFHNSFRNAEKLKATFVKNVDHFDGTFLTMELTVSVESLKTKGFENTNWKKGLSKISLPLFPYETQLTAFQLLFRCLCVRGPRPKR